MSVWFEYSNAPARPTGPVLRVLGTLVPPIARVRAQAEPYAVDWQSANARALAQDGPVWISLGDSMAQGVGGSSYDQSFISQLSRRLQPEWPHRLVNLSVFGARVEDALDTQIPAMEHLAAQGIKPDLVTAVIGSNNIVSRRHRRGLVEKFTTFLDLLPAGAVIGNFPNPHRESRQIDALLRQRQSSGQLHLADMRRDGPRSWRGLLADDSFHPNDRGYAAMADVMERPVRATLGLSG